MEYYINLVAQVLFAIATIFFVIYSVISVYTFNTYGHNKSITMFLSILYCAAVISLLSWAWVIIGQL